MSILKKNITFKILTFPELLISRNVVAWMPQSCCFKTPFGVIIERNSCKKFQCNYLQNQKYFLELLLHFLNLHKILSILKKNLTFITLIFPELLILKNVLTWIHESSYFRTVFGSKRGKASQTLLKSTQQPFYGNFSFMSNKVSCVSCLLGLSKMWGASFNTFTANDIYSCHNKEKFLQQVPTQFSSRPKTFCGTFIAFLEST